MNSEISIDFQKLTPSYKITIGSNLLSQISDFLATQYAEYKIIVITDKTVYQKHGESLHKISDINNIHLIQITPGETSKSRKTKNRIEDEMLALNFSRQTIILAIGGGIVGDISGFVASTYKRGIPFVQVPTTLLAMVDSSVGGKTAINTEYGKNLIGTFWQPAGVFVDLNFLNTLDDIEVLNGISECLKVAVVLDSVFFDFISTNCENILNRDPKTIQYIIEKAINLKKRVVELDVFDAGYRQILNFGHTIGHSLELVSKFKIKHGFAVAVGMVVEAKIAELTGFTTENNFLKILNIIKKLKLDYKIQFDLQVKEILMAMKKDKKNVNKNINFIILKEIGKIRENNDKFSFSVSASIIEEAILFCQNLE